MALGLGAFEGAPEPGEGRIGRLPEAVALDGPEGQAEREGGVGIDRVALILEEGPSDQGILGVEDPLNLNTV